MCDHCSPAPMLKEFIEQKTGEVKSWRDLKEAEINVPLAHCHANSLAEPDFYRTPRRTTASATGAARASTRVPARPRNTVRAATSATPVRPSTTTRHPSTRPTRTTARRLNNPTSCTTPAPRATTANPPLPQPPRQSPASSRALCSTRSAAARAAATTTRSTSSLRSRGRSKEAEKGRRWLA